MYFPHHIGSNSLTSGYCGTVELDFTIWVGVVFPQTLANSVHAMISEFWPHRGYSEKASNVTHNSRRLQSVTHWELQRWPAHIGAAWRLDLPAARKKSLLKMYQLRYYNMFFRLVKFRPGKLILRENYACRVKLKVQVKPWSTTRIVKQHLLP